MAEFVAFIVFISAILWGVTAYEINALKRRIDALEEDT